MNCEKCDLHLTCKTPCLMGVGNKKAKVMLVGEAPGYEEDKSGVPFVGLAGQLLNFTLFKLGVDRDDLYITNLIKCRPPNNTLPKSSELKEIVEKCKDHLEAEIKQVKPTVIVALGGTATSYLTGQRFISKCEGLVFPLKNKKVVACYHPAYVLRSPSRESNMVRALFKAMTLAGMKLNPKGIEAGVFDYEIRG